MNWTQTKDREWKTECESFCIDAHKNPSGDSFVFFCYKRDKKRFNFMKAFPSIESAKSYCEGIK